jgi:hypothetical protein
MNEALGTVIWHDLVVEERQLIVTIVGEPNDKRQQRASWTLTKGYFSDAKHFDLTLEHEVIRLLMTKTYFSSHVNVVIMRPDDDVGETK